MIGRHIVRFASSVLLAMGAVAFAQEPKPVASVPGNFRSFVVADERFDKGSLRNRAGKMHCLVSDNGLYPVVAVFSRTTPDKTDAGLSKLVARLDKLVVEHRAERLGAFVVFLTLGKEYPEDDQRDLKAKAVADLSAQLKSGNVPFGVAASKSDAVAAWEISDADDLTVILYSKMKIIQKWTFAADKPIGDEEAKAVEEAVKKLLKK